jgi:hypothetical protein
LRQAALELGLFDARELARVLSPGALTGPRATDVALRRRVQRSPAYRAFRRAHGRE